MHTSFAVCIFFNNYKKYYNSTVSSIKLIRRQSIDDLFINNTNRSAIMITHKLIKECALGVGIADKNVTRLAPVNIRRKACGYVVAVNNIYITVAQL